MSETVDRVEKVNIFPIKSFHASMVDGGYPTELNVGLTGFEAHGTYDREYLLYDPNEGTMVTQRGWAAGSQKVKFKQDAVLATAGVDIRENYMAVRVPNFGQIEIDTELHDGPSHTIQVFGNDLQVIDQGRAPSAFFSKLLERDVQLMRADPYQLRPLPERYQRPGAANVVAGADGMPFLLLSQASLDFQYLKNGKEIGDTSIDQYRGSIIIGGYAIGAFMEDRIELMRIGTMAVELVKECLRCPIPNIDQDTGVRGGAGGLTVLRGRIGVLEDGEEGVGYGQNGNHVWEPGVSVAVGDSVYVVSVADEPNIKLRAA